MRTFMHYRKYDRMGQIEARGGLTLAIEKEGLKVKIAMAECGRKDNFRRSLGRTVALGRLEAGKVIELEMPDEVGLKSFVHAQEVVRKKVAKLLAGGSKK